MATLKHILLLFVCMILHANCYALTGATKDDTLIEISCRQETAQATIHAGEQGPPCDTLYLVNGVRMIVKVTKAYKKTTWYRPCDGANESEIAIETAQLKQIHYSNGTTNNLQRLEEDPADPGRETHLGPLSPEQKLEHELLSLQLDKIRLLFIIGILLPPVLIVSYIRAKRLQRSLKDKKGFELEYKRARKLKRASLVMGIIFLVYFAFIFGLIAYSLNY